MPEREEFGAALAPGVRLEGARGEYELVRVLGQGGFGITYAAVRTYDGVPAAIKEYYPSHCAERSGELVRAHPAGRRITPAASSASPRRGARCSRSIRWRAWCARSTPSRQTAPPTS